MKKIVLFCTFAILSLPVSALYVSNGAVSSTASPLYTSTIQALTSGGISVLTSSGASCATFDGGGSACITTETLSSNLNLTKKVSASGSAGLALTDDSQATANGLFVEDGGNVGVNTLTPQRKFSVVGDIQCTGNIYQNLLIRTAAVSSTADDGTITLAMGVAGILKVWTETEYMQVYVDKEGVVTSIYGSANTANTDTDTKLCVYDGGTGAVIKNRLGATKIVRYEYLYK
jgi:hypothetical protein